MMFSKEITGEEERTPEERLDAGEALQVHSINEFGEVTVMDDIKDAKRVYGDNRDYALVDTVAKINNVLLSDSVHSFAKQVLQIGLTLDSVDAVYDLMLVLECLQAVLDDNLKE